MKEEKKPEVKQSEVAPVPKKDTAKMVWMIIAIIAIIALIGSIAFGYMSMKNLNKKISDQQAQINDLQNTKKTLEDAASAAATAATNAAAKAVGNAISGQTDTTMIESAIKADCAQQNAAKSEVGPTIKTFTVKSVNGNYAQASFQCNGASSGTEAILVKSSGNWVIVAKGSGDFVPDKVRTEYNIPSSLPKS